MAMTLRIGGSSEPYAPASLTNAKEGERLRITLGNANGDSAVFSAAGKKLNLVINDKENLISADRWAPLLGGSDNEWLKRADQDIARSGSMLERLLKVAEKAKDVSLTDDERLALQEKFDRLQDELNSFGETVFMRPDGGWTWDDGEISSEKNVKFIEAPGGYEKRKNGEFDYESRLESETIYKKQFEPLRPLLSVTDAESAEKSADEIKRDLKELRGQREDMVRLSEAVNEAEKSNMSAEELDKKLSALDPGGFAGQVGKLVESLRRSNTNEPRILYIERVITPGPWGAVDPLSAAPTPAPSYEHERFYYDDDKSPFRDKGLSELAGSTAMGNGLYA